MKRLERLGSAALLTVIISLVFHLLAMSYGDMIHTKCISPSCNGTSLVESWKSSLVQRCYQAPIKTIFASYNRTSSSGSLETASTDLCVPNKYITAKSSKYAYDCMLAGIAYSHMSCALGEYNSQYCKCDYTSRTKASIATSVLASISLGIMLFLSHFISFVKIDYVLRWLIPVCFGLLTFSILFIILTLAIIGSKKNEDIQEAVYRDSLIRAAIKNESLIDSWKLVIKTYNNLTYVANFGFCFGLEILSLHFAIVTLVLYGLMFTAKKRPESVSHK